MKSPEKDSALNVSWIWIDLDTEQCFFKTNAASCRLRKTGFFPLEIGISGRVIQVHAQCLS